jgi:hypothetical protein
MMRICSNPVAFIKFESSFPERKPFGCFHPRLPLEKPEYIDSMFGKCFVNARFLLAGVQYASLAG